MTTTTVPETGETIRTYYGQPVLKEPTWHWYIPAYFYLGGMAAGSSILAAGADLTGDARLARAAKVTAVAAIGGSAGALVADLGVPSRFHHMLRVFRPTSPMNVGSWLLGVYGPAVGVAALTDVSGRFRRTGSLATWGAALVAPAIATYTAVLIADTAIPAWHDARRTMPSLFASGAAAAAGGVVTAVVPESGPARSFAMAGGCGEAVWSSLQHRTLAPEVAKAYHSPKAKRLNRFATIASVGGSALVALAGNRRPALARAGGVAIALAAAAERFSVVAAGHASAADPAATIAPQRRRAAR